MAQLKDTVVTGDLSVTGTIYGDVPLNDLTDADDLKAIEALTGTSGILTKTAANTWSLSSGATPASHTHGKITNDGKIANADNVAIANGDRLIISDSSDSYILKNTSITFDGSTETKALTQKGTWATFNNYSHPTGAGNNHIPSGGSSGQFLGWSSAGTATWVANPNTDTKVTQAAAITTAGNYPVLLAYDTNTTAVTNTVNKTSTLIYNPNTKELTTNGTITLGNGTTATLNAKTPSRSGSFIIVGGGKNTAGNGDGTAIRLGAGGLTLVGGGEYASNRYNVADLSDRTEQLYLGADGAVFIETNANTVGNRNTFNFTTAGNLEVAKSNTDETKLEVSNTNGALSLNVSTNRGIWDVTGNSWMVYRAPGLGQPTKVPSYAAEDIAVRNIGYGTEEPAGGNDGDVYIQYSNQAGSLSSIIDIIYPVGSIYMNVSNINPATLFGGTWERIAKGQFLLGYDPSSNSVGDTGGATHVSLSIANLPAHAHQLTSDATGHSFSWGGSGKTVYAPVNAAAGNGGNNYLNTKQNTWAQTVNTGSGTQHGNMPPYLVVAMWQRIS